MARLLPDGAVAACIAFVFAFPMPFFYQVATYYGLLPPVLGNGYSACFAIAFPFAFYAFMNNYSRPIFSRSILGKSLLLFYLVFMIRACLGLATNADPEIVAFHFLTLGQFAVLFAIARYLPTEEPRIRRFLLLALMVVVSLVLVTSYDGQFLGADILKKNVLGLGVNYQGPAFIVLAMFILGAPGSRGPARYFLYGVTVVCLYIIGARSEFAALLAALPAIEFCRTTARAAYIYLIPMVGLVSSLGLTVVQFTNWQEGNRIVALLDLDNDLSAIGRRQLLGDAIATIYEKPLFGEYAGYGLGNYAHNILSAWVDFGVIGFLLACVFSYGPIVALIYLSKSDNRNLGFAQSLACAIPLAILMSMAKAYSYLLIPLAIGVYCRYIDGKSLRKRALDLKRWPHLAHVAEQP